MSKIVFFGDSITDANRDRQNDEFLGGGYAAMVKNQLCVNEPYENTYFNRGIGGNRIVDLYAQINGVTNLNPDVMSILIGVNDVWHKFYANPNGVKTEKFERVYSMLIDEIKEANPDVKIMILEPFVLRGTGTEEYYSEFRADVEDKAKASRRIAEKYNLPFVELQSDFDRLYNQDYPATFVVDGVHPSPAGHTLIANKWIETYNKFFKD